MVRHIATGPCPFCVAGLTIDDEGDVVDQCHICHGKGWVYLDKPTTPSPNQEKEGEKEDAR